MRGRSSKPSKEQRTGGERGRASVRDRASGHDYEFEKPLTARDHLPSLAYISKALRTDTRDHKDHTLSESLQPHAFAGVSLRERLVARLSLVVPIWECPRLPFSNLFTEKLALQF